MRNFRVTHSYDWDESIDVCELVESIFDYDNYCGDVVRRKGTYDRDKQTWLGFVDNTVTLIERNVDSGCPTSYVRLGDPRMIASMMTAVLQQDKLPFMVQAEPDGSVDSNHLQRCSLEFYKIECKDN